jgi:hypothetical protein
MVGVAGRVADAEVAEPAAERAADAEVAGRVAERVADAEVAGRVAADAEVAGTEVEVCLGGLKSGLEAQAKVQCPVVDM